MNMTNFEGFSLILEWNLDDLMISYDILGVILTSVGWIWGINHSPLLFSASVAICGNHSSVFSTSAQPLGS